MAYNGSEGKPIEPTTAGEWTKVYREQNPNLLIARLFGRDILEQLLAQPECQGIRFYYGPIGPAAAGCGPRPGAVQPAAGSRFFCPHLAAEYWPTAVLGRHCFSFQPRFARFPK